MTTEKPDPFKDKRHTGGKAGRKNVPEVLRALRNVSKQPKEQDATPLEKKFREMFDADFKAFSDRLVKAEREFRSGPSRGSPDSERPGEGAGGLNEAPELDAGSERCIDLIDRLLKERAWENDGSNAA